MSNETAPPGATTQVKISVTEPKPILTGGGTLDFTAFDSVFGIAIIAPGGDTYGVALERGTNVGLSVLSPSSNFGMNIDYPILTIAGRVPATAPIGAKFVLPIDAAAFHFVDSTGAPYPMEANPGQLTIGNGVAIGKVSPGSAVVQAGGIVTITGTNFVPNTSIVFKEAKLSQVRFVSATRIDVVLAQTATMHGMTVIARNPDGSQATYFSYERTHAMSASADPVMRFAVPLFPPKTGMTALIPLPAPKTGFTYGVALQDIDSAGSFATMQLVDGDGKTLASAAANIDLTFSNFAQVPATVGIAPPLDGTGNIAASAVVNTDGSVSLAFTSIDPATGAPALITGAYMQSLAYDVTVTNPALLLGSVNQRFGPGTGGGFNVLTYRAPAPSVVQIPQFFPGTDGTLIFDNARGSTTLPDGTPALANQRAGVLFPMPCVGGMVNGVFVPATMNQMDCASPLPGGYRASIGLENFFGVVSDNHSFVLANFSATGQFAFDGIAMTFTLVPADTPVTPIPVTLAGFDVSQPGIGSLSLAHIVDADGLRHPGFAPAGGVPVTLTTSDAAALPLPATLTMPQGSSVTTFTVGDATIDAPAFVIATATYNGVTLQQTPTVNPAVPLTLMAFGNVSPLPQSAIKLGAVLNRVNFSPAVIAVTCSNPAVVPAPASLTIPALTIPQELSPGLPVVVTIPVKAVAVDTPVTFTGTFNGVTLSSSVTIPKTVDFVTVSKAELVVRNLALRVEATSTVPTAVLTLFNAATGRLIGTMTNSGLSGSGAKYSFQGTVSPVTSVLLTSSFSGTATGAVAQK